MTVSPPVSIHLKLYMAGGLKLLCIVEFCYVTNRKETLINCWKEFYLEMFPFKSSGDIYLCLFLRLLANAEQKESFQCADLEW